MKTFFLTLSVLIFPVLPLIAAGDRDSDAEPDAGGTVVTFRSWSPVVGTTEKMISAFEQKYPDITIEAAILNYPEYIIDLKTRAAAGTMPDLAGLQPGAMTQEYRAFLAPAQQRVVDIWGENWRDRFHPIGLEQVRLGNPSGDDNFYGLPVLLFTLNAWYTIPLLEEGGFDVPETYDDLLAISEYFKDKGVAGMMIGAADGWLRRDIFMQLIHNIAPGLIYKAEDGEARFTEDPFIEAFTWWKKFFDDGIFQDGALGLSAYPGSQELIEAGRAATFPMGAWWMQMAGNDNPPPLSRGLAGFAPMIFPDVTGRGVPEGFLGGVDVMIGITEEADPAAALVLTEFISGTAAQQLINTFNDLPAVKGLEPEPEYFESENQRRVWDTFTNEWMPQVKYARELKSPDVRQALEDALAAVAVGELTPREAAVMVQNAWTAPN